VYEDLGSATGDGVATGDTTGMSSSFERDEGDCGSTWTSAGDMTYIWSAPEAGTYTIDTHDSSFDTVLRVYTTDCGTELECNDDSYPDGTYSSRSAVTRAFEAGEEALFVVDGYSGTGAYILDINCDDCGGDTGGMWDTGDLWDTGTPDPIGDCAGGLALVYSYSAETAAVEAGAAAAGMTVITASSSAEFATLVTSEEPEIAIFSTPTSGYDSSVASAIDEQLTAGRKVITAFWYYTSSPDLTAALGVTATTALSAAPDVSPTDSGFWSVAEILPDVMSGSELDDWGTNGALFAVDSDVIELATDGTGAVIVQSHGGNAIVNGLLFDDYVDQDVDGDGTNDTQELVTNEVVTLCGGGSASGGDDDGDALGVPSDGGDAVLDFRCAEWDGTLCIAPQVRIPDGECDAHTSSGEWVDTVYYNSPEYRICPKFCQGMTGSPDYSTCTSGSESISGTVACSYSIGTETFSSDECSSDTYRWWVDTPAYDDGWTGTISINDYGSGQPQLNIECDGW
jgi:hypothetical protein